MAETAYRMREEGWETVRRLIEILKFPDQLPACTCGVGAKLRADHKRRTCPMFVAMRDDMNAAAQAVGLLADDKEPWMGVLFLLSASGALDRINKE